MAITRVELDAKHEIFRRLPQWQLMERALDRLAADTRLDPEACLLKACAINSLYSTQIRRIVRMAALLHDVLSGHKIATSDDASLHPVQALINLVEDVAESSGRETGWRQYSFAAKFFHFFVDPRCPILDDVAEDEVHRHIQDGQRRTAPFRRYETFCKRFDALRATSPQIAGASARDIDRYLWLSGSIRRFNEGKIVNRELHGYLSRQKV